MTVRKAATNLDFVHGSANTLIAGRANTTAAQVSTDGGLNWSPLTLPAAVDEMVLFKGVWASY